MADVFISYHRSEGASALVRRIAGELENRGVSCWYDTKNKAPVDFIHLILAEINACKVFLFLWDEESNKAPFYVRREVHTAATAGNIQLFPFCVGNFEMNPVLKFYFGPLNILYGGDLPENARIEELVEVIADTLGDEPAPRQKPKPEPPSEKEPEPPVKRGQCGNNVTYTLDKSGLLTISGEGPMWDFALKIRGAPWFDKRETVAYIEIRDGVTTIGDGAFYGCAGLKSVTIPDSVTIIEDGAFYGCAGLTSVAIPDSVAYIGVEAFADCTGLTSVSVPAEAYVEHTAFPDTVRVTRGA